MTPNDTTDQLDRTLRFIEQRAASFGAVRKSALTAIALDEATAAITRLRAENERMREDAKLLDTLRNESWDLRCFPVPTGGDDADIGWRVVSHWMAEPHERIEGEVYHDDPRAAIREALSPKEQNDG